jgi:translation initiation factor IF-3
MSRFDALALATSQELDLVEVSPMADPPVCRIIDYGKFRYDQTKREKESKKAKGIKRSVVKNLIFYLFQEI